MKLSLVCVMGLLFPSIVACAAATAGASEQETRPDRALSDRPDVCCILSPFGHRARDWMLAVEGGLLNGEQVHVRSAWKGEVLEIECSSGNEGFWGNSLHLAFDVADPHRPTVEAEFSWYSDAGPFSGSVHDLRGRVTVTPMDGGNDWWTRDENGWDGRTKAEVGVELHGTYDGEPKCIHGVFVVEPAAR